MNDKLVSRATVAYHELLTRTAKGKAIETHFLCSIKDIVDEINEWSRRLKTVQTKGWKTSTHLLKQSVLTGLTRKAINHFSAFDIAYKASQENMLQIAHIVANTPSYQELFYAGKLAVEQEERVSARGHLTFLGDHLNARAGRRANPRVDAEIARAKVELRRVG